MTGIAVAYEEGVFASRPAAAGRNGYAYFATDTGALYHSNGSAWTLIAISTTPTGVSSINKTGSTALTGAVTLTGGTNVTLTQSGQDISIAASGGGSGIGAVLFDSTLGADTASIDTGAGGIAGGYNVLQVWIVARTDEVTALGIVNVTLNNDTGANYDRQTENSAHTTLSSGASLAQASWVFNCHGTGGTANYASILRMTFPAYTQTNFYKIGEVTGASVDGTNTNCRQETSVIGYRSTTAISRLKVASTVGGNLKAGSRLLILGF